jgi:hypothetical protein
MAHAFDLQLAIRALRLALSESFLKPTTMLYRNMLAMDAEEQLRGQRHLQPFQHQSAALVEHGRAQVQHAGVVAGRKPGECQATRPFDLFLHPTGVLCVA